MNPGWFCERLFHWVFVIHTAIESKHSVPEQIFIPAVSHMKVANVQVGNTLKRENCFAILISVCNFHISLQFSYQFANLMFQCIVTTWTFAIFIWVCNFHMSLQFSYEFAIFISVCNSHVMTPALTILTWLCMDSMSLWPWTH